MNRKFKINKKNKTIQQLIIIQAIFLSAFLLLLYPIFHQSYTRKTKAIMSDRSQAKNIASTKEIENNTVKDPQYKQNMLIIPAINVEAPLYTTNNSSALDIGMWHKQQSGSPEIGGNMVITGHRFKYLPPYTNTLYNLHKLKTEDKFIIYWEKQFYQYQVKFSYTTEPNDTQIEATTHEHQITLYTCTPIWSSKKRLIIVALPI